MNGGYRVIYNLDGSRRGYEWVQLDASGKLGPSKVYAQEGRDDEGRPLDKRAA